MSHGLGSMVIIFMMGALVGPFLSWATWPPNSSWPSLSEFIVSLVLLLWPAQPLGVIEHGSGTAVALFVTIGANIIFFGLIGLAVGAGSRQTLVLLGIYLLVASLVCLVALWAAGFNLALIDAVALATALAFYAGLFWFSTRRAT